MASNLLRRAVVILPLLVGCNQPHRETSRDATSPPGVDSVAAGARSQREELIRLVSLHLNAAEVESLKAKVLGSSKRNPPEPTPDEESAFRACRELVDGHSPRLITDDELDRMRRAAESYERRTGRPLLYRYEIMVAAVVDSLGRDYDEENARCLLASTKSRRAVITRRFEELGRQAVRIGGISESQHRLDLLHLESQSKGKPWLRADGTSSPPITRDDIESSMKDLANRRENHRRFYGTILEFAAIP